MYLSNEPPGLGFSLKPPKKIRKAFTAVKKAVTLKRVLTAGAIVGGAIVAGPAAAAAGKWLVKKAVVPIAKGFGSMLAPSIPAPKVPEVPTGANWEDVVTVSQMPLPQTSPVPAYTGQAAPFDVPGPPAAAVATPQPVYTGAASTFDAINAAAAATAAPGAAAAAAPAQAPGMPEWFIPAAIVGTVLLLGAKRPGRER